jgi:hypothetical protein
MGRSGYSDRTASLGASKGIVGKVEVVSVVHGCWIRKGALGGKFGVDLGACGR